MIQRLSANPTDNYPDLGTTVYILPSESEKVIYNTTLSAAFYCHILIRTRPALAVTLDFTRRRRRWPAANYGSDQMQFELNVPLLL